MKLWRFRLLLLCVLISINASERFGSGHRCRRGATERCFRACPQSAACRFDLRFDRRRIRTCSSSSPESFSCQIDFCPFTQDSGEDETKRGINAGVHRITSDGIPKTGAASVIVMDANTGQTLYEKNADPTRAPASTQKLLTALIVAERGFLDQPVTVQPSRYHRGAGEAEREIGRNLPDGSICCARCS